VPVHPTDRAAFFDNKGMVGVTKIGRGNANYWIEAVAEGGDDYYTKPGEAPGQWMGELAAELGLSGEVDRAEYTALLAGKHPKTGKVLVKRPEPRSYVDAAGKKRRLEPILGYDIRFSAPKSISLLWAIGSPEVQATILHGHDYAIGEALGYLERHACFVQRGHGGVRIEPGAGFLSMSFLHRSSRAGDMALHSHLVTANMTRAVSDGRWLSLANPKRQSPLLREAKPAGYVYQAALRAFLTREIGVEWQAVVNGYADIAGFERPLIEHFSRRRNEIVEEMAERGTSSAAAAEVAAYRTRDAKDYEVDPDTQRQEWRSRAAEFDFSEESIERMLSGARAREPRPLGTREIDASLADLESTHSHFDRRDLLCALANRMREGTDAGRLEAAVEALLTSNRVVEIHHGEEPLAASYFTTPRLWEMEQRILKSAREGQAAGVATVEESVLAGVLARHRYLSDEQALMVRRLTTGGERIVTVAALPGSGKTTALKAAREAWSEGGFHGIGVATARSASGELEDAGIPATSIAKLLIRCEEAEAAGHQTLPRGVVIVMDESSATSTPHYAALVELIERYEGKLVCIGDPRQIGAVGPGGSYGVLTNEIDTIVLTEIRRQREPVDRRIVELAHEGRGSDALDLLRAEERVVIGDTLPETLDALVLDWHERFAAGEDAVMIARRGRDVADLNERAREVMATEGRLGNQSVTVAEQEFAVGDRVITRVNSPQVSNRERWEVTGVDASEQHLMLQRIGGDERAIVVGPRYLERRTDSGEPSIQHAYALTTYATQSKTFDSAFSLLDSGIAREDFLVAVSRARGETTAYGVAATDLLDPDLGPARREITDSAHDLRIGAERVAAEYAAAEVSARKRIEALQAFELVIRRERLAARLPTAPSHSPVQEQLDMLDRRTAEASARLAELASKREAALAVKKPDKAELALIESAAQMTSKQLGRLEGEREPLADRAGAESRRPSGLSGPERAELAMIEDRLLDLRRSEVASERMRPSEMVTTALGPRPADPTKAALWNEGVDLIYAYRQRNRLISRTGDPLGLKPKDAARRRERRAAELRLQRIQRALDVERLRAIEHAASIVR
jgi:conjugative relaxase-like TrwC/TraI family protein